MSAAPSFMVYVLVADTLHSEAIYPDYDAAYTAFTVELSEARAAGIETVQTVHLFDLVARSPLIVETVPAPYWDTNGELVQP